jgi:hypothetical protein
MEIIRYAWQSAADNARRNRAGESDDQSAKIIELANQFATPPVIRSFNLQKSLAMTAKIVQA